MIKIICEKIYIKICSGSSLWLSLFCPGPVARYRLSDKRIERFARNVNWAWIFIFCYYHRRYFYLFREGCLQEAYASRMNSLYYVLMYGRVDDKSRAAVVNYIRCFKEAGCLYDFLDRRKVKKLLSLALFDGSLDFIGFTPKRPVGQVCVIGPLVGECDIPLCGDVVCIKPERFSLDARVGVWAYYNKGDLRTRKEEVEKLIAAKKIMGVLTPDADAVDAGAVFPLPPLNFNVFLLRPLSLLVIVNSLLLFGYEKIQLLGFSFYAGSTLYSDGYYSALRSMNGAVDVRALLESLSLHDLAINYILLRHLLISRDIDVDGMLGYMKETSLPEYLLLFQKSYGLACGEQ